MDVAVIGGGPAGAAAARMLAFLGHDTVLLEGGTPRPARLAESLPPSCRKPLAALGLLGVVEGAGFLTTVGNTAAWAGEPLRSFAFEGPRPGWQVERGRFDEVLRAAAAAAGVRVVGRPVAEVDLADAGGAAGGVVRWQENGRAHILRARWVLDCSGRAGVVARRRFRLRQPGPATLAIAATWEVNRSGILPDPTHTLVESYREGWAWSVPETETLRHLAVMVDPRVSGLSRGAGLEQIYRSELEKTAHHRELLPSLQRRGSAWACVATPYSARQYAGQGFLLVGDAGSSLDPLSSFGVKKALASAWLAAVVVNTSLRNASMQEDAQRLFDQRERAAHRTYAELARDYYRRAAQYHRHPFWTSRVLPVSGETTGGRMSVTEPSGLLRNPAVAAALEFVRSVPRLRLRQSARARRVRLPVVQGSEVVLAEHLVSATVPEGLRLVQGVELPRMVDLLARYDCIPDLFEALRVQQGPIELPDFLAALSVLIALDLVESQGA